MLCRSHPSAPSILERLQSGAGTAVAERPLLESADPLNRIVELKNQPLRLYPLADLGILHDTPRV